MPAARAEPGTAASTLLVWAESGDTKKTSSKTVTQKRRAEPWGAVMPIEYESHSATVRATHAVPGRRRR